MKTPRLIRHLDLEPGLFVDPLTQNPKTFTIYKLIKIFGRYIHSNLKYNTFLLMKLDKIIKENTIKLKN